MIQNPNSSGQGFDPEYKDNPYHNIIVDMGLNYSHTTPITRMDGAKYMHHTYKLNSKFSVGVNGSEVSLSSWCWQGSVSGSGRMRCGYSVALLKKYLKGAVRRHSKK